MRHWETQGEPHNLNSGLGSLPGGGVRNQSSLSLPHISAPQPPWVPVVDSGCVLESTFLEAGSGWQDIGAAKGSNAGNLSDCCLQGNLSSSFSVVFLSLLCNCQECNYFYLLCCCFSLLLCSLSWSFSLCSLPPFSILVIFFNDILFISFSSHADPQLKASFYTPSFHSIEKSPRDSALL